MNKILTPKNFFFIQIILFIVIICLNAILTKQLVLNSRYMQLQSVAETQADTFNYYLEIKASTDDPMLRVSILQAQRWFKTITNITLHSAILDSKFVPILLEKDIDFSKITFLDNKTFVYKEEVYLYYTKKLVENNWTLIAYVRQSDLLISYNTYIVIVTILFSTLFSIYLIFSSILLRKFDTELSQLRGAINLVTDTIKLTTANESKKLNLYSE